MTKDFDKENFSWEYTPELINEKGKVIAMSISFILEYWEYEISHFEVTLNHTDKYFLPVPKDYLEARRFMDLLLEKPTYARMYINVCIAHGILYDKRGLEYMNIQAYESLRDFIVAINEEQEGAFQKAIDKLNQDKELLEKGYIALVMQNNILYDLSLLGYKPIFDEYTDYVYCIPN